MNQEKSSILTVDTTFRQAVGVVALLNLFYFGIEFITALGIGSVSLIADSIDFLEDACVNLLILIGLGWTARRRASLGMALAGALLVPGLATLWMAWHKLSLAIPPAATPMTVTGAGALAINLTCAFILAAHRHHQGSLARTAFLSARNDAYANVAIILSGFATAYTVSAWPDLTVGLGISVINAGAAKEVFTEAQKEHREAQS